LGHYRQPFREINNQAVIQQGYLDEAATLTKTMKLAISPVSKILEDPKSVPTMTTEDLRVPTENDGIL